MAENDGSWSKGEKLSIQTGILLHITDFRIRWVSDRGAGLAFDSFCQHVDHGLPVFDDQGVGRFIGHDTAFR